MSPPNFSVRPSHFSVVATGVLVEIRKCSVVTTKNLVATKKNGGASTKYFLRFSNPSLRETEGWKFIYRLFWQTRCTRLSTNRAEINRSYFGENTLLYTQNTAYLKARKVPKKAEERKLFEKVYLQPPRPEERGCGCQR